MHTALVQRLLRDRGAWELAHRYESAAGSSELDAESDAMELATSAETLQPSHV
jgi:hypothetical protein